MPHGFPGSGGRARISPGHLPVAREAVMTEREALTALRGDDIAQAARAAQTLWQMWHRSGDPRLDGLLAEGIDAMERQDIPAADAAFTRLIEEAPAFAEAWNKRATLRYVARDYPEAIPVAPPRTAGTGMRSSPSSTSDASSPSWGRICSGSKSTVCRRPSITTWPSNWRDG